MKTIAELEKGCGKTEEDARVILCEEDNLCEKCRAELRRAKEEKEKFDKFAKKFKDKVYFIMNNSDFNKDSILYTFDKLAEEYKFK